MVLQLHTTSYWTTQGTTQKTAKDRPFLKDSLFRECGDAFHLVLWRSKTPATAPLSFITKSTLFKTILDAIDMHG